MINFLGFGNFYIILIRCKEIEFERVQNHKVSIASSKVVQFRVHFESTGQIK